MRCSPPTRSVISAHSAVVRPSHQSSAGRMTSPRRSRNTDECICPEMPTALTGASPHAARAARIDTSAASHQATGSCSAHPGCGVDIDSGVVDADITSPDGATRMALTPLVPTSRPRKSDCATLPHSEEDLHRELVETLVAVAACAETFEVELLVLDGLRELLVELHARARRATTLPELADQLLDLNVRVELRHLLLEDEIGAHAAAREVPDAFLILGAVRMRIKVTHAGPLRVLQQLHQEERRLGILASEAMILIVAAGLLRVEVDVEQLP